MSVASGSISKSSSPIRIVALIAGPILAVALALFCQTIDGFTTQESIVVGVAILCAVWWVFEPVPVPATSLIPLAVLPALGVMGHKEVAHSYGDTLIMLLMCGFMISRAMESSGAHKKVALGVVHGVARLGGGGSRSVVLGFMIAAAALSMWISNTATTLMLLPVAIAIIQVSKDQKIAIPLLLGLAYAANIGGIGTPIGTPPNIIFMGQFDQLGSRDEPFGFVEWMKVGIPVVVLFVPIAWFWLTRGFSKSADSAPFEFSNSDPWTSHQKRVLGMFFIAAALWVFQKYPLGGWVAFLDHMSSGAIDPSTSGSATVAALVAVLMFVIPNGSGGRLLTWESARTIPWGVLILFGGGIALAGAFVKTGLSERIAENLQLIGELPLPLVILLICLLTTFLTEVTSNTAMTTLMMPILGAAALGADIPPQYLMMPAAMSASCAFMLPVATAPNAAVYGTERIPISKMAREGLVLNCVGIFIITGVMWMMLPSNG